jgi:broad specificity phosphatase PhoE
MPVSSRERNLIFLRHAENSGDALTDAGIVTALEVGEQLVKFPISLVVVSGAQRTAQTAACVLASGQIAVKQGVHVQAGFGSTDWTGWGKLMDGLGTNDIKELAEADQVMVDAAGEEVDAGIAWTRSRLGEGQHALIVSHNPIIELAIWRLTGTPPAPFARGQWHVVAC